MEEYKEGVPFEVKAPNGEILTIMFKETGRMDCKGCVFEHTERMPCWDFKCTSAEREDGLNGIYVEENGMLVEGIMALMEEHKEGIPFDVRMPDGNTKKFVFKRRNRKGCGECVFSGNPLCDLVPCLSIIRNDGINGIYLEVKE